MADALPALDFVSPLPPVRSGIADYSADLLPHLAPLVDLRVVRLPGQPVAPEVEARWRPVPAAELRASPPGARLALYQMGNNLYHEAVLELALERPGVVTLHDLVLHHLLQHRTIDQGEIAAYEAELAAEHGWVGAAAARPRRWGAHAEAALFSLPAHRSLLAAQRGVLVHGRWAAGVLADEMPGLLVRAIPMGIPLPPPVDPAAALALRRRLGIPEGAPVLGSFGFQTPIKRTATVIAALAAPGLAKAHLLIVGELSPAVDLAAAARRAGVADRVHVTGFVGAAELQAAIAASDLCVNLRYPTAGETSASLLRVLAAGRGALVSDYAQFSDLPPEVAVPVPLGEDEVEALAGIAGELLAAPGRLAAMGEAARDHVRRHHDPAAAAAAVAAACAEWSEGGTGRRSASVVAAEEPCVPSSLLWPDLAGRIEVEGAEAPWPEGERRCLRIRLVNQSFARWLAAERGPGGVGVEIVLRDEHGALDLGRPWLALPADLPPGGEATFEAAVRRPPGRAWLRVEPWMVGGEAFHALGGPFWEREI